MFYRQLSWMIRVPTGYESECLHIMGKHGACCKIFIILALLKLQTTLCAERQLHLILYV